MPVKALDTPHPTKSAKDKTNKIAEATSFCKPVALLFHKN
jgi:hypothetical protein